MKKVLKCFNKIRREFSSQNSNENTSKKEKIYSLSFSDQRTFTISLNKLSDN